MSEEDKLKVYFPANLNMELMLINEEAEQVAEVTIGLGFGKPATLENVRERIAKFESEELEALAPGFRLPNRREFIERKFSEKAGMEVAVASQAEFDD